MANGVRAATKQVWDALRAAGRRPSVRQVYVQVGGAYTTVAAECRGLRAATAPPPASPRVLPQGVHAALWALYKAIQEDPIFAHNLRVRLSVMQNSSEGPLTRVLDAIQAEG
jgi:Plasmid replication region DNA-binding N-term